MVTGLCKVFTIDVYALLDPDVALSSVTHLVSKKFDILHEPFIFPLLVGESVVATRVYRNCPIMLPNRVSYV